MSARDARLAAQRTFGRTLPAKEDTRAVWAWLWLERLAHDVRYGCRMLARNPGFTIVAVLSIAIGVGANAAIFSFADAIMLRPLPVPDPNGVVSVGSTSALQSVGSTLIASYPEYRDIRERARSFDGLAAFENVSAGWAARRDATPRVRYGMAISANFFDVLGVVPSIGRTFRREEDQVPGRDAVVMLSHDAWTQEFGGDNDVAGRSVWLNGREFTIVGVAPEQFSGIGFLRSDFYVPLMMQAALGASADIFETRTARNLQLKGRLRDGVSLSLARAELAVIAADMAREHPEVREDRQLLARTEIQNRFDQDRIDAVLIAMLSALSLAVLLVACANVAGLLTSRAPARAREMAMRLSIGASRARVVRQLITESLLVALLGGAAGLAVGDLGVRMFNTLELPTDAPLNIVFELDGRVLFVTLLITVVSAVMFGLAPALSATRTSLTAVMKAGDAAAPGHARRWGRSTLVVGQVALSVLLLVVAVAIYRSFDRELAGGPGFRTDHLVMMTLNTSLVGYDSDRAGVFYDRLIDDVRGTPGVQSATLASTTPMGFTNSGLTILPDGYDPPRDEGPGARSIGFSRVDEGYFDTLGIAIVEGRGVRRDDDADSPRVAVVNERLARRFWPDGSAIGARFRIGGPDGPSVEIVGVAKNSKYVWLAEPPLDYLYLPIRQSSNAAPNRPPAALTLLAQGASPAALAAPLREAVHAIDRDMPIADIRTMQEFFEMRVVGAGHIVLKTIGAMGVMGLGLAIVGVYGLVAYGAARRTREIGVRIAIGASRGSVLLMVLRQGAALTVLGLALGLPGSLIVQQLLRAVFPAQTSFDPLPLLLVVPVVLAVAVVAAFIPAQRAANIDPILALRAE